MATVKLVIRKDKVNLAGECPIFILYTHNQKSIKISTNEKIDPEHWEPKKGQVKKSYGRGYITFNDTLKTKMEYVEEIKRLAVQQKIEPTLEYVKEQYSLKDKLKAPEANKDFYTLFEAFMWKPPHLRRLAL
jgi:hypothetical protein